MVSRVGSVGGIRGRRRFIQSEAEKFAPALGRIAGHATGFGGSSTRRRCGMSPTMNRAPGFTRCATRESMCEPDAGAGVSVGINRSVTHRATTRCPQTFLRKPARETGAARAMGAAMVQDMVDILPRSKAVAMGKKTHSRVLLWRVSGARRSTPSAKIQRSCSIRFSLSGELGSSLIGRDIYPNDS